MNPLKLAVDLARDYAYVVRRQYEVIATDPDPEEFAGSGSGRPIVVLPGIYEDWRFMRPLVLRLAERGHPVHVVPELRRNRATIARSAVIVREFIAARDLREVVLVAHSKGGLIGKQVLIDDVDGRIAHMVAVNTPFAGSRYARYAIRRELREFSPRDVLLQRFATILDINERITSVFSAVDPVVPDGSLLPGAHRNIRLPFLGHFRILADVRLLTIIDQVAAAPPDTTTARPIGDGPHEGQQIS
jgi:pimeloyl-ACP methyl ester carboxylesterase